MRHTFKIFSQVLSIWIFAICFLVVSPNLAIAAPVKLAAVDFTKQTAIEVKVNLSNNANELKFFPDRFTFESANEAFVVLDPSDGVGGPFRLLAFIVDDKLRMNIAIDKLFCKKTPKARALLRCSRLFDVFEFICVYKTREESH